MTTLSNKVVIEPKFYDVRDNPIRFYPEEDVKEFIRELKKELLTRGRRINRTRIKEVIDKLAGEELSKEKRE